MQRQSRSPRRRSLACTSLLALSAMLGCTGAEESERKPCDPACQDRVALRGLREIMKLAYNLTLQGNPVGPQDETTPCPLNGQARVFGEATSNPVHGATEVTLTYEFTQCTHLERDEDPAENYALLLDGTLEQVGTIAVQPSATSALVMSGSSVTIAGYVYDPPIEFVAAACEIALGQDGSNVSGLMCGREVGLEL